MNRRPSPRRPWSGVSLIDRLAALLALATVLAVAPAARAQTPTAVCFFADANYGGASLCVDTSLPAVTRDWRGRISSVRVAPGARVDLYSLANYTGSRVTLTASAADLRPLGFDNLTSSAAVTAPTTPPPAACASGTASWSVGAAQCTASRPAAASGVAVTVTATGTTATGSATYTCGNGTWSLTGTPTCAAVPAAATTRQDAARLLMQAAWGPTAADIDRVVAIGPSAWIDQQFATAPSDTHWDYVMVRKGPIGCNPCNADYMNAVMESWWTQVARGQDVLRQRMVLALAEIFVVSAVNSPLEVSKEAHASWLDMLSRNAFGNYRTLLEQVSTHPAMGMYLSHLRNEKEDAATGRTPDENYAREVMQLFSIGLWQLNEDGTRRKDAYQRDIPTYGQADVMGLARVFTGWAWGGPDKSDSRWNGWQGTNFKDPMQNYPTRHSTSEKRFLGTVIPAGTSGEESLRRALDTLANHPNVGPFIGRQLIQRFVTSNPSPAYVARVARVFANNGAGVRGDLRAVLRAVLLDPEARDATRVTDPTYGKLREPLVRLGHWLRAFDAKAQTGWYRIWNLEDPVSSIGQNPQRAPSVFNWFRPGYAPPGDVMARGLVAPEFQITHETTATGWANFVTATVERGIGWNADAVRGTYTAELALAGNPAALVDRLNWVLTAGQMSATTRDLIVGAVQAVPSSQATTRVNVAIALTMLSPEFLVQR